MPTRFSLTLTLLLTLALCAGQASAAPPSFAQYRRQTIAWMQQHRAFQTDDHPAEIAWNAPQFSHMSLLFSPDNPLYGRRGSQRICWNGQDATDLQKCLNGEPVWYSDYGLREPGKVFSRLTFNPYFQWQAQVMLQVLDGNVAAVPQ